jgi:hypothetical protein
MINKFPSIRVVAFGLVLSALMVSFQRTHSTIYIALDTQSPQQQFGAEKVIRSLERLNRQVELTDDQTGAQIIVIVEKENKKTRHAEGFHLKPSENQIKITSSGQTGAMYGLLELAEQISRYGSLDKVLETEQSPRFDFRAIKFNLPWSSYRRFEGLQANMEAARDLEMWRGFLDMMAENRFNTLTLWNLHPWPYLVRSESFPDANPFNDEELAEWKRFWTQLFQMAKDRGIETYLLNWNIFVTEEFTEHYGAGNIDGSKYNIEGIDSPQIREYTRESITQVINEYPNLSGLGVSLGEGMKGWTTEQQVEWVKDVFFKGIHAADRPIKFIYRAALSGTHELHRQTIEESGLDTPENPIIVELKFNGSHAFSTTRLVRTHGGGTGSAYWSDPVPEHHKMAWMMRNEDFYRLRWGEPDFIRSHIQQNGQEYVAGYFIGSENYIPALDIFSVPDHPHVTWDWAFERQWLFYMQWGRLLYNPELVDSVFANAFNQRYKGNYGEAMTEAYKLASRNTQRIAGFFPFSWDFTLYTEGFMRFKHHITLKDMVSQRTTDPDFVSIRDYGNGDHEFGAQITPLELASIIESDNTRAMELVESIRSKDPTLQSEIEDVKAWCYLGNYFANKLRAATAFNQGKKDEALTHMEAAIEEWKNLISVTEYRIQPSSLGHMRGTPGRDHFHWKNFLDDVESEIDWIRQQ